jgi:aminomethyltransferase
MSNDSCEALKRTAFYDLHIAAQARMVPFAGYEMPVQYPAGIMKEHLHTRASAGLFDVSHMGQIIVSGAGVASALEKLLPVDVEALAIGQQCYAMFTNSQGGIEDDLIITRWAQDQFFLVVNAACKEQDLAYLQSHLQGFDIQYLQDQCLLALQGPAARKVMEVLAPATTTLLFMNGCHTTIEEVECFVTRSGYTGEDGFEISFPVKFAEQFARRLLAFEQVEWVGLGARDTLRLEAGLCLYGHDMNNTTSPVTASLLWSISKSRRSDGAKAGGFPGAERIFQQQRDGVARKRVGFRGEGRAPVREGAEIVDGDGQSVGVITSGGYGPSVEAVIAIGYVDAGLASAGTRLNAMVRGKPRAIVVSKMPFIEPRYQRAK